MYAIEKVRSKIQGHIQQQRPDDASDQIIPPSTEKARAAFITRIDLFINSISS